MLKLDLQGYERDALRGARATLSAVVGIQIELSFTPLYEGGMLYDESLALLRDLDFEVALLAPAFVDPQFGSWLQADAVLFRRGLLATACGDR